MSWKVGTALFKRCTFNFNSFSYSPFSYRFPFIIKLTKSKNNNSSIIHTLFFDKSHMYKLWHISRYHKVLLVIMVLEGSVKSFMCGDSRVAPEIQLLEQQIGVFKNKSCASPTTSGQKWILKWSSAFCWDWSYFFNPQITVMLLKPTANASLTFWLPSSPSLCATTIIQRIYICNLVAMLE